jgi:hypothetical protein
MSNNKQTAVEWLIEKIKEARRMCDDSSMEMDIWHTLDVLIETGKQAKEMEKQQRENSYSDGWNDCEKWFAEKELHEKFEGKL